MRTSTSLSIEDINIARGIDNSNSSDGNDRNHVNIEAGTVMGEEFVDKITVSTCISRELENL